MKNLKRVLSMALATAMVLGMMVVGSGAANMEVEYDDAIAVVKVLGIMEGDENGNFNGDKVVTRNEMAVVMSNLAGLKLNGAHPFTDVPDWADPYVGALYINGLTSGTSATTYGGGSDITTTTAALMIMRTLGYFEYQGEFGEDWALATVKKATELTLFNDIEAGVNDGLTRGELAQMIVNALDKDVVVAKETGGMSVEGNGITVTEKPTYSYPLTGETLIEKLFYGVDEVEDLKDETPVSDVFGRVGTKYVYVDKDGEETTVKTYEVADKVLVAEEATTIVDLIDDAKLDYDNADDFDAEIGAGYVVELFVDENDADELADVVVYYYEAIEIDEIEEADEDQYEDEIADGAKYVITTVAGDEYLDIQLPGLKIDEDATYIVMPYVVERESYAVEADKEIGENEYDVYYGAANPEVVTGKATTVKSDEYVKVDGTKYVLADAMTALTAGTEYDLYLDGNGYVVAAVEVEDKAVIDDIYVVDAVWSKTAKDSYNVDKTTYYAQLVDMAGEVSTIELEGANKAAEAAWTVNAETGYIAGWDGALVTISDKKWELGDDTYKAGNDKFDMAVWAAADYDEDWDIDEAEATLTFEKDDTRIAIAGTTYRLNSNTQYVLIGDTGADLVAAVKVGGIAVTNLEAKYIVICEDGKTTVNTIIVIADAEIEEDAQYSEDLIFIKGKSSEVGDDYVAQTVYYADGTSEVLNIAEDQDIERGFFSYSVNEDGYYEIDKADDIAAGSYVWEDQEGVIVDAVITSEDALYEGLLTVGTIDDIKVADAKFVDAHDKEGDGQYTKAVTTLAKVMDLLEKGTITSAKLSMNVSEDGAVIVIVTDLILPVVEEDTGDSTTGATTGGAEVTE